MVLCESWYHGTPDSREVDKNGFADKKDTITYIEDPQKLKIHQDKMQDARDNGDMDEYHKLLDMTSDFKKSYTYIKPVFLSDKRQVASTYADANRAFDYQNANESTYEVEVNCNKIATIKAIGDRFRFISVDKVKKGFMASNISEDEIDKTISMFNFYVANNKGISTDVLSAIGSFLGFDCVDVVGVLDSYNGGRVRSTVKMVLKPSTIKIKK